MAEDLQQLLITLGVEKDVFEKDIEEAVNKSVEKIKQIEKPSAAAGKEAGETFAKGFGKEVNFLTGVLRKYFGSFGIIAADALENFKKLSETSIAGKIGAGMDVTTSKVSKLGAAFRTLGTTMLPTMAVLAMVGILFKFGSAIYENWKKVNELNKATGISKEKLSGMLSVADKFGIKNTLEDSLKRLVALLKQAAMGSEEATKKLKNFKTVLSGDSDKDFENTMKEIMAIEDPVRKLQRMNALGISKEEYNSYVAGLQPKTIDSINPNAPYAPVMGGAFTYTPNIKTSKDWMFFPTLEQEKQAAIRTNLELQEEFFDELVKQDDFENKTKQERLAMLQKEFDVLMETQTVDKKAQEDLQKKFTDNITEQRRLRKEMADEAKKDAADQVSELKKQEEIMANIANLQRQAADSQQQVFDRNRWSKDQLVDDQGKWLVRPMTRQGEQNIRGVAEVKNAEAWAKRYKFEGREDLAQQAQDYADKISKTLTFLPSAEQDPMANIQRNTRDIVARLDTLNTQMEQGKIKATPQNG